MGTHCECVRVNTWMWEWPLSHIMRAGGCERESVFRKPPKQLRFVSARIESVSAMRGLRAGKNVISKDYVTKRGGRWVVCLFFLIGVGVGSWFGQFYHFVPKSYLMAH